MVDAGELILQVYPGPGDDAGEVAELAGWGCVTSCLTWT